MPAAGAIMLTVLSLLVLPGDNTQGMATEEKILDSKKSLGGVLGTGISRREMRKIRSHPYAGRKVSRGKHEATAYGPPWNALQGSGITSTGIRLGRKHKRYLVAVDPSRNKYGSLLRIWPNPFRWRGPFVAADTGGAIQGQRIDFYDWRGRNSQYSWGRKTVRVTKFRKADFSGGVSPRLAGGLSADDGCPTYYTAKEHRRWAKRFIRRHKIPRSARLRHQEIISCAAGPGHRIIMRKTWKRVRRSTLPPRHNLWIRIARCEQPGSGYRGVYWAHPGPTYQGGLGFWYGTWDSFKYRGMPDNAGQATWRQQMKVANRLYRKYGTSPWGCA